MPLNWIKNAARAALKPVTQAGASVTRSVQSTARSGPSAGGSLGSTAQRVASASRSIASVSAPVRQAITRAPVLSRVAQMGAASVPQRVSAPTVAAPQKIQKPSTVSPMRQNIAIPGPSKGISQIKVTPSMDQLSQAVQRVATAPVLAPARQAGAASMQMFVQQAQPRPPQAGGVSMATIPIAHQQKESLMAERIVAKEDTMASQMLRRQNQQARRLW